MTTVKKSLLALLMSTSCIHAAVGAKPTCNYRQVERQVDKGAYQGALDALKKCDNGPQTQKWKGFAFHGLFAPDSALHYLKLAHDAGLREDDVLIRLAEAFLWKKNFRDAAMLTEQVKDKKHPEYMKVQARKHEILGEFQAALKLYDAIIPMEKLPYGTMERKAIMLSWTKQYDEAVDLFGQIIATKVVSKPLKIRCMIRRAEVISWKKEFDKAISELDKVLVLDKKNSEARLIKGRILEWKGDYQDAKSAYKEILVHDASNDQAKLRIEKLQWVQ